MGITAELVVLDSRDQASALCLVCGNDIPAGEGVTASYQGQTLRFKCPGCFSRFQANPEPFLAGRTGGCCGGEHDHSPASEWSS
jgi:YHS domain-containing protein